MRSLVCVVAAARLVAVELDLTPDPLDDDPPLWRRSAAAFQPQVLRRAQTQAVSARAASSMQDGSPPPKKPGKGQPKAAAQPPGLAIPPPANPKPPPSPPKPPAAAQAPGLAIPPPQPPPQAPPQPPPQPAPPPAAAAAVSALAASIRDPSAAAAAPAAAVPETFDQAEARGLELAAAGEYERAVRMFELAQTLPGEGVDFIRQKQGASMGNVPNPRDWAQKRFATAEQKMIAEYNIACCYAQMGDAPKAMEMLRTYIGRVGDQLNQVNEMLVDTDLVNVRDELRALRDEIKAARGGDGGGGGFFTNPLGTLNNKIRDVAESVGVEWK